MKDFDDGFSAHYKAVVTPTTVLATKRYCYPGAVENGEVRGIGVEFYSDGVEPWFATFAAGGISPNAAHFALHHPNPWKAFIVSKGDGYIVDVRKPSDWADIPMRPIMGVLPIAEGRLLICWDFTRFIAIGLDGVTWRTPRLSWDGIRGVHIEQHRITAEVWDAAKSAWVRTTVETANGSYSGGSSP